MNLKDKLHDRVFIPVSVEKELPDTNRYYNTICNSPIEMGLIHYHKETGWQNGFYTDRVTHWLKQTEQSYVLSPEELRSVISEAMGTAFAISLESKDLDYNKNESDKYIDNILK